MIQLISLDKSLSLLLALGLLAFTFPGAISKTEVKKTKSLYRAADVPRKKDASKVKNLRRVDFRLKGSNCASCLGRIRKRMSKLGAVLEAAVIIKKPHGAAAIYDGDKITKDEILAAALKNERVKVKIIDVNDRNIDKMPFILVPKFNQLKKK